jgi:PAS domain S-box-containing protein
LTSLRDLPVSTKLVGSTIVVFLLSFLALAFVYSRGAENAVMQQANAGLEALRASRSSSIQQYFDRMERRLELVGQADWSREMLRRGPAAYRANRREYDRLRAPVDEVAERMSAALGAFDMLFVDRTGTILYSSQKQADLGTNLRAAQHQGTPLALLFERIVAPSAPRAVQHADYHDYAAAGNAPTAFIGAPVVDRDGTVLGATVFKLPVAEINAIMGIREGLGETGENYLVGPDSLMRTDSRFGTGRTILRQKVVTPAALRALAGESGSLVQQGYRGVEVLAVYAPLEVLGTTWANVVVLDRAEVLKPIVALRNRMALIGLLVFLVSGAVLVWLLRALVLVPLKALSLGARRVQQGQYDEPVPVRGGDELGELGASFNQMVASVGSREEELVLANFLADTALDLTRSGYWHIDFADTGYYQASPRAQEIYGEPRRADGRYHILDEWLSRIVAVDPKAAEIAGDLYQGTVDGKYPSYEATHPYKRPEDGRIVWLKALGKIVRHPDGRPHRMYGVVQDITPQTVAEQQLKTSEERLEAAASGANLGLWEVDPAAGTIVVNEILESQLAYERGELRETTEKWAPLLGGLQGWPDFLHPDDRPRALELIGQHINGQSEVYKNEHRVRSRDGSYKWILSVGRSAERDAEGHSLRVNGVHIDISEMKALQQELETRFQELKKLEELRDSLTHMIVHDLRSPLTAILGYLELMVEDATLAQTHAVRVQGAMRGAKSLIQIINALLDVNKMEAGEMKLDLTDADLVATARETLESLSGMAGDRSVVVDDAGPVVHRCDHTLMGRVVANLLGNAYRYSPKKSTVTVRVRNQGDRARVEVQDQGNGIPEEYRERIFQKFGRVEGGKQHAYSTGLGLTFCKLAVEAHGGTIGVDSVLKQGSTFWFELPMKLETLRSSP